MRRETTRASRSLRLESRSGGGRRRRTQRLIRRAACRRAKAAARHLVTAARPPGTGAIAAPRTRRLVLVSMRPRRMLRAQCKWRSSCRCTTSKTVRRAPCRRCTDTSWAIPVPDPRHHRRQRQHRPHLRDRRLAGCTPVRGPAGTDRTARPGGALAKVWTSSEAEVLVYMDVDLSTDLNAVLPLVAPAWLLPAASRFWPAQSPSTAATAHTRRTPSHEY